MKISICIPTYNRSSHLRNCLESIYVNYMNSGVGFEICISDNASTDDTESVVSDIQKKMPIIYKKALSNRGMAQNFLNVVAMASGEFVWMLGDDDLIVPHALASLNKLIEKNGGVDFFYINSYHLTSQYVLSRTQPFNTLVDLPENMDKFSPCSESQALNFFDLIDPKFSFDFLGGIFLAVFRRKMWVDNVNNLNRDKLNDLRTYSNFDNTFPHTKIYSYAFKDSKAYFSADALSISLTGVREWAPMYPFIQSVRLVEVLNQYRKMGLGFFQYLYCKNSALKYFIPDLISIYVKKGNTGKAYTKPFNLILQNFLYPNFYLSFVYFIIRKSKIAFSKLFIRESA